jgi:diaminopimelate decarboxylase
MPNAYCPMPTLSPAQLSEIATVHGTPVYVYHADRIAHQYNNLKKAFGGTKARFFMPVKH